MNERPTPETDAEHAKFAMGGFTLDFCRKLERERDEARDELRDIRLNLGADAEGYTLLHAVCIIQNERDEAREIIRRAKTKFCEEGSDGNIASDMFAILSSGGIAQWLEQSAHNRLVVGSNPSAPTL